MKRVAAVAVLVLAVSGCGGGDEVAPADESSDANVVEQEPSASDSSEVEESADPDLPDEETVDTYFESLDVPTLESLRDMKAAAKPGSNAAAYAEYQLQLEQGYIDGGVAGDPGTTLNETNKGYDLCYPDQPECTRFTDIKGADGKVADFTISGRPIAERLTIGDGTSLAASAHGVRGTFLASYVRSLNDDLVIVFSLKTAGTPIAFTELSYRSPAGRQSQASTWNGPANLAPRSLANYNALLPGAEPGGTVVVKFYNAAFTQEGSVTFKTR